MSIDDQDAWECPNCGQVNMGVFLECQNCGTERSSNASNSEVDDAEM